MGDREAYLLDEAAAWAAEGLITPEQYDRLKARYAAPPEEARRRIVVRALLAVGVVLVLAGVGHVLADVHWSAGALAAAQAVMSAVCLAIGLKFHRDRPDARSGQALISMGAMFFLGAIGVSGYTFDWWQHFQSPWLVFFGGTSVAALGFFVRFPRLHALGVALVCVAAGLWLNRAGMDLLWIPLTVGLGLAAAGLVWRPRRLPESRLMYLLAGLGVAALAGWALELRATGAAQWGHALLFTLLAALPVGLGIRERDDWLAGLGIWLLVLDVYTQYYVLLWDAVPRVAFFLVGGLITLGLGIAYERFKPMGWLKRAS